jgi:hypothetical protein
MQFDQRALAETFSGRAAAATDFMAAVLCAILRFAWHRFRGCPRWETGFLPRWRHRRSQPSSTVRCHSPLSGA